MGINFFARCFAYHIVLLIFCNLCTAEFYEQTRRGHIHFPSDTEKRKPPNYYSSFPYYPFEKCEPRSLQIENKLQYIMTEGEDTELTCSVIISNCTRENVEMQWVLPHKTIRKQPNFHNLQIVLPITNVTEENVYTCIASYQDHWKKTVDYVLKFRKFSSFYINLKTEENSQNLTVNADRKSVSWTVNIDAFPTAAVTWFNPKGRDMSTTVESNAKKYKFQYDGKIATLTINNLSIADFGVYKMRAFNYNNKKTLTFNLTVNDKPTVQLHRLRDYNMLVCVVTAFPLAEIKWFGGNCPSGISRNCTNGDFEEISSSRYNEMVANQYEIVSILKLTANENGKFFVCNATNERGNDQKVRQFLSVKTRKNSGPVTDLPRTTLFASLAIFAIIFGALFVLLMAMVLIQENKNGNKPPKKNRLSMFDTRVSRQLNPRIDIQEQAHLLPYDSKLEFPREKLYLGRVIGSGAFGYIKKAVADGIAGQNAPTSVAVKTIDRNANRLYVRLLVSELKLLIYVGNHPNLVNILGACTANFDTDKEFSTIVEYCKYGNLRDFLLIQRSNFVNQLKENGEIDFSITRNAKKHKLPGIVDMPENKARKYNYPADWRSYYQGDYRVTSITSITTNDLIQWAHQTTCGMEYLANRKVLHGDLTARNLLICENMTVKICNFGLAKNIYQKDDYREIKTILLPMKWMALESIKLRKFSVASDVWSFGVTLWEIFSLAEIPFPDINSLESLYETLASGERLDNPPFASKELYAIMKECWNYHETARPTFPKLRNRLRGIQDNIIRSSSNAKRTREPKMTDVMQDIHLQDKICISHDKILQQITNATRSSSTNISNSSRNSFEMKPRNSSAEKEAAE